MMNHSAIRRSGLLRTLGMSGVAVGLLGVAIELYCLIQPAVLSAEPIIGTDPDPQPRVVLPDESMYTASPADGGGRVRVAPGVVTAGRPCTLTFVYTAGEKGIAQGGGVLMYVTQYWYWSPPQDRAPESAGYVTVDGNTRATLETEVDPRNQTVLARVVKGRLAAGDTIRIVYGDTSNGASPQAAARADRYAEHREGFFFKVDGDGDGFFTPIAGQPHFDIRAQDAVRLVVFGPSRVAIGAPIELRISALDASNNLADSFRGAINLTFNPGLLSGPSVATIRPDDGGSIGVTLTAAAAVMAKVRAATDDTAIAPGVSNTIVLYDGVPGRYQLYWADLHIHGNLSDGTGTPQDIYHYARNVARLDVSALTEHDHWGYLPLEDNDAGWRAVRRTAERYNQNGRFVTFCGYEWTNWTWGHQHVLFADCGDAVIWSWCNKKSNDPLKLWKRLAGLDCITIPHHPGGGPVPTCWKYYDPTFQPVVEVVSVHGISERMGQPGGIYAPEASGMVQSALARGYRLGMIGSGDTHDGHPALGTPDMPPPGLAGIYAEDLTGQAILDAVRTRRVYATNGCRAILRFHSGRTPMGGVIALHDRAAPRRFQITIVGDAPIAQVTMVKNNRDVADLPGDGFLFSRSWQDTAPAESGDYYYARIGQIDGGMIWSSPIWVEVNDTHK